MARRLVSIPLAVVLLTGAFASSIGAAKSAEVARHDVRLTWTPDNQDIVPGPLVVDTFDSHGPPFGEKPVETRTPRSQIGQDTRSGKWRIFVSPGSDPGRCVGTFDLDRDVLETTQTTQTVRYDGTVHIKGCVNSPKFRRAQPGKLGDVHGKSVCTATACTGGLKITGSIRY